MRELDNSDVPPTRAEVVARLRDLIAGRLDRDSIAEWAGHWVSMKEPPIEDPGVWKAVERLSGADMISTDRPFLYDEEDFEMWLAELLGQVTPPRISPEREASASEEGEQDRKSR